MAAGAAAAELENPDNGDDVDMADAAADAELEHGGDDVDMADAAGIAQQRNKTI